MNINPIGFQTFKSLVMPPKVSKNFAFELPCRYCVAREDCFDPTIMHEVCEGSVGFEIKEHPCEGEEKQVVEGKRFFPALGEGPFGAVPINKGYFVEVKKGKEFPFSNTELLAFADERVKLLPKVTIDAITKSLDEAGIEYDGKPNYSKRFPAEVINDIK